nr:receptor-like protein 9DC3 [Solanum lycopersicum]
MEYQQLLIAFCFYSIFSQQSQLTYAGTARDEAFYLLQFRQGLRVDSNSVLCENKARTKNLSWDVTGDCCEWDGVTYLSINEFRGSIPESIGNLTAITELRLPGRKKILGDHGNNISGFQELRILDLSFNCFTGAAPHWLFHLPSLFLLSVEANQLTGKLPNELKNRSSSSRHLNVYLSHNKLHGKIPDWMLSSIIMGTLPSNLFKSFRGMMDVDEEKIGITRASNRTHTRYLYHVSLMIKGNEFDMRITSIMTSVDLSSNRFEGDIPNSIGSPLSNLTFLEVLNLSYNHLAGCIPIGKQFNTFPNDSYCGNCDLYGFPLSKECGNNNESPLEHDDDDDSFFMSGFTWEAVVITYVVRLLESWTSLSAMDPSVTALCQIFIGISVKVFELDFSYIGIFGKGSIPESIGNLPAITELTLSDNNFTGNVPSSIRKLNKISFISLSSNNFKARL